VAPDDNNLGKLRDKQNRKSAALRRKIAILATATPRLLLP
jgi:hypothetical protein